MHNINNNTSTGVNFLIEEENKMTRVFLYNLLYVLLYPPIHNLLNANDDDECNFNVCDKKQ